VRYQQCALYADGRERMRVRPAIAALLGAVILAGCGSADRHVSTTRTAETTASTSRHISTSPAANTAAPYFTASTVVNGKCTAGCAIEGQRLQVTTGTWSNSPTSYSYRWQDCITDPGKSTGTRDATNFNGYVMTLPTTASCSDATGTGANTNTYTVGASDLGKALAVTVTATNSGGSRSTSVSGTCDTGLMSTSMPNQSNPSAPPASTYFDNGTPGCSPISAVVGTAQTGTGTSGEHFCTNGPITCGFADIADTGPPAGTVLQAVPGTCTSPSGPGSHCSQTGSGWSYSNGTITPTNGATIKGISFTGDINISGVRTVTVENSDITDYNNLGSDSFIIGLHDASRDIKIQNNNLHGLDAVKPGDGCDDAVRDFAGDSTNVTIANNNIWFCGAPMNNLENGDWAIEDNYVHDFAYSCATRCDHFDGIQFEDHGNDAATAVRDNTILTDFPQTDAIILSTDFTGPETNREIIHNLLAGGGYSFYGGGPTATDITFSGNVLTSIYFGAHSTGDADLAGANGPDAYWNAGGSGNTWSNNVWDDNGTSAGP
jgi:hypothetical protein